MRLANTCLHDSHERKSHRAEPVLPPCPGASHHADGSADSSPPAAGHRAAEETGVSPLGTPSAGAPSHSADGQPPGAELAGDRGWDRRRRRRQRRRGRPRGSRDAGWSNLARLGGWTCGPGTHSRWPFLLVSLLAACAAQPIVTAPRTYQGGGGGAAVGTGAGALIDKDNRWRGAARGAALGDVLGGSVTAIASRAARESVSANQPVAYQSTDGWQRVEAVPQTQNARGCRQVHERVYQDNELVREQIREVC